MVSRIKLTKPMKMFAINGAISMRDVPIFKLMKEKALRKHSLHEKTAASVLLKLLISGNE